MIFNAEVSKCRNGMEIGDIYIYPTTAPNFFNIASSNQMTHKKLSLN
jgi:hypothetical protein